MFKFGRSGQRHLGICRLGRACPICCQSERGAGPRGICIARSQGAAGLELSRWPASAAGGPSERIPLSRGLPLTPPSWRRQWSWLSRAMNLFCAFLFPWKQTCPLLPRAARDQVALHDFPQTSPEAPFSINLDPELQGPENKFLRTKCKELIV